MAGPACPKLPEHAGKHACTNGHNARTQVRTQACLHVDTQAHMHSSTKTCISVRTHTQACMCARMHVCAHVSAHIQACLASSDASSAAPMAGALPPSPPPPLPPPSSESSTRIVSAAIWWCTYMRECARVHGHSMCARMHVCILQHGFYASDSDVLELVTNDRAHARKYACT